MGVIKDLVDLVTQLNSSVEDRKFAGELRQIQSMIGVIQSEHAEIHEQRIELLTENAELKQTIASLKEEIEALNRQKENLKVESPQGGAKLSDEEEKILLYLSEAQRAEAIQVARSLNQNLTKTEFWIRRLCDLDMVNFSLVMNAPTSYYLVQGGREYLVENGLI
ncbi:MAG: hypothetical protein KME69_14580 [Candidatus Thiodiazotropha sp. (ex Codakia orbicularis)]|nr:hypothetical protein [Candidatus Thiodiazotropha sp. (ex Codakia orbicularis)]